jgi:hypothetical protein
VQYVLVEPSRRCRAYGRQHQQQHNVPTQAMILVQLLRVGLAAIHLGHKVLREAHESLQEQENVGDEAQNSVGRLKVSVVAFIDLDDDEAGYGGGKGHVIESGVRVGAGFLLRRSMGWLEDEDALDEEKGGSLMSSREL